MVNIFQLDEKWSILKKHDETRCDGSIMKMIGLWQNDAHDEIWLLNGMTNDGKYENNEV